MNKRKLLSIASILILALLMIAPVKVSATEAENGGGGVQTNGNIGFYEEESTPSTSYPDTKTSSTEKPVTKPVGKYPSTGELVKTSLSISGAAIILIAALFFFVKKRKEKEEGN